MIGNQWQMAQKVSFDTIISCTQGAGRDQLNIIETNKTQTQKHQKTIKIQYSFKIPAVTLTIIRNHREMAHKKRMRPHCTGLSYSTENQE